MKQQLKPDRNDNFLHRCRVRKVGFVKHEAACFIRVVGGL